MLKGLARFFAGIRRPFEAFQIEVSSYNSLECQTCPRWVFAEKWIFQNMPLETYGEISRHFPSAKWVSFRGWGEPLENEDFPAMHRRAKEAGCLTSLTTNGDLLTGEVSRQLIEEGLDLLVVSMELAAQAPGGGLLRPGSDLRRILDQTEAFLKIRQNRRPAARLSFPMTRLNMGELPFLVPLAARMGADELVFTHLDYLPEDRWNILRAFYHESPTPAFQETLDLLQESGKKEGIPVRTPPLKAQEIPVCEPDPPHKVFFSVDGSVSPCPYLRIPKKGEIPRIFMHKACSVPQTSFGQVPQEDFGTIWDREPYQAFRRIFEDRGKAAAGADQMLDALSNPRAALEWKPPPPLHELCRTCYKAYGI